MENKILRKNFKKNDFVNFIIDNDIFYEFIEWQKMNERGLKNERFKKSFKLLQELEL